MSSSSSIISQYGHAYKNSKQTNGIGAGSLTNKESAWDRSNLLAKYGLTFMWSVFAKNRKRDLTLEDIGAPPRVDHSRTLGLRLQQNYNKQLLSKKRPNFLRALFKTFGTELMLISIFDFVSKCIAFPMQTIALGWLIRDAGIYLNFANPDTAIVQLPAAQLLPTTNATGDVLAPQPPLSTTIASSQAYWRIIHDAILLIMFTMMAIVFSHPFFFQTSHIGMKCRIASCYMIYKKSLRLSQSAMSETTVGQMVNLLSNDVNRFDQVAQMLSYLVMAPLQAAIILTILLLFYLGTYPTLASVAAITVYVAIQTSMGRGFSLFRNRTAKRTDERVRLMNEIILAMRIIKLYTWEKPFKLLVTRARRREITTIGISSMLKCINQTLFFVSSKIIVFVALITYVMLGNSFNPEIVFVSIGLANLVRVSLTLFFPNAIAFAAETVISCRRINNFLMLPEISSSSAHYRASSDGFGCKYAITISKIYASWGHKDQDLTSSSDARMAIIRNLSLSVRPRELVLIVGRVGSGKSSVLMSMLGELPIASGRLEVNGRIAYASQEAWIFSGTVRDNILFGKPLFTDRYNEVIRVCSLERDLEILVNGDATIVGERGVSLSGGQKARVNLARALYQEADIYLLDDPLSAVDAPVAKHIFNESLRTFLRKKTVLLATHQLQFLRYASRVLVVDRDSPAAFGTLQEVMESDAFRVVNYSKADFEDATTTESGADIYAEAAIRRRQRRSRRARRSQAQASGSSASSSQSPTNSTKRGQAGDPLNDGQSRLIKVSSRASSNLNESVKVISPLALAGKPNPDMLGDDIPAQQKTLQKLSAAGSGRRQGNEVLNKVSSDYNTYIYYVKNATGIVMLVWFVLTNLAAQGFYQAIDFFLSYWTDSVQRREIQGANFVPISYVDNLTSGEISIVYSILVAICFTSAFLRTATYFIGTLRASINIHNRLFESVVHAPMTFFDFSPIGILLNRLSRDIGFVDETLPQTGIEIITIFVNVTGIIVLSVIIDYTNLVAAIILLIMAFVLRSICAKTITRLKQIEGVTRSPIFSHLSTTLSGLPTIRAFRVQDEFVRMFDRQQDTHSSAWFTYICAGRWLTVCMDWLCLIFIILVISMMTFSLNAKNASIVGLLISQTIVLPGPFQWGIRQLIEIESQMTSVQRIKEFSELKSEEELMSVKEKSQTSSNSSLSYQDSYAIKSTDQDSGGAINFRNVSLSYFADEPPVLKSLNFSIKPREKIGIVGRTGAGKSSIVSVLFRLYDFQGSIEIDGRDTKSMPLVQLRQSMSIIPQDPILFGATIRKNLDPFGEFPDLELWAALEAVQLKRFFLRQTQGLDFVISEGGSNFSVGQRQLICLARAIVRRNKVLILDEATANVDPETDVFIQRTIGREFAACTVLTIAHRLITIVDSDRVLVLDRGQVREFASPHELLADETSLFSQMVASSAQQAPRLRKLIEDAHKRRLAR